MPTVPEASKEQATAAVIDGYRPAGLSESVSAFARSVVCDTQPTSPARARALLWACSRLAAWGEGVGLALSPLVLFHPSTLERYLVTGLVSESATLRRSARANLRFVARAVCPEACGPSPEVIGRDGPKAPYRQAEIDGYLALAHHQPTQARRQRLSGLVCLGAGAGLSGPDLRLVTGHHVIERSGGVVVCVEGPRERCVPVLARYQDRLVEAASFAGSRFVCGGESPHRRNVTASLVGKLSGGADLPRLEVSRLRATWLAEQADRFGMAVLLEVSGLKRSSRLGDLVSGFDPPDEAVIVALCGAVRDGGDRPG
jgi:hypothetical protein